MSTAVDHSSGLLRRHFMSMMASSVVLRSIRHRGATPGAGASVALFRSALEELEGGERASATSRRHFSADSSSSDTPSSSSVSAAKALLQSLRAVDFLPHLMELKKTRQVGRSITLGRRRRRRCATLSHALPLTPFAGDDDGRPGTGVRHGVAVGVAGGRKAVRALDALVRLAARSLSHYLSLFFL